MFYMQDEELHYFKDLQYLFQLINRAQTENVRAGKEPAGTSGYVVIGAFIGYFLIYTYYYFKIKIRRIQKG